MGIFSYVSSMRYPLVYGHLHILLPIHIVQRYPSLRQTTLLLYYSVHLHMEDHSICDSQHGRGHMEVSRKSVGSQWKVTDSSVGGQWKFSGSSVAGQQEVSGRLVGGR